MNRRSFLKRTFAGFAAIFGIGGGTYYYAREIEPKMLEIKNENIASPRIPNAFRNFKIVQFSDTHIGFHYTIEQLDELVKTINDQQPDLIVFTGDLVDKPQSYNWPSNLAATLQKLTAEYGKFWIYGNHDHGGYGTDIVRKEMEKADFQLLQNDYTTIQKGDDAFILTGIDDAILGNPNLDSALPQKSGNLFTMLLAHEPDFADIAIHYPIDVQLSGHSHGGQVRFPFIGHLYTPILAQKYVQGKFMFTNENMALYVSRGIGTTRLPYRFLCKPEIHVFTLQT